MPTFPLDHDCAPAHSMHCAKSFVSRMPQSSIVPGERPQPRESTRTQA